MPTGIYKRNNKKTKEELRIINIIKNYEKNRKKTLGKWV
jgi:hypothetical protein